ncbi:hypothetical protein BDW42DRAFT_178860 [Aspergillus taichungensis]|uniref:Uncharacterized protein n=1 Tax=Aspergillus taichungensis TaxID=482145 RepID=A0A2J5HH75_9EURO|nr:hypothetical protein BDW42DRAFT_178860 [Aspergillus taichungensis]
MHLTMHHDFSSLLILFSLFFFPVLFCLSPTLDHISFHLDLPPLCMLMRSQPSLTVAAMHDFGS